MSLFRTMKILLLVIVCIGITGSIVFATPEPTEWSVGFRIGAGVVFAVVAVICIGRNIIFEDEVVVEKKSGYAGD